MTENASKIQSTDPSYTTEEYNEDYYQWVLRNRTYRSHKWRLKWMDACIQPKTGDKIIDLGCGAGLAADFLSSKGAAVHGVDLSDVAIKTAKQHCAQHKNATFEVGDASNLPHLASGSFDKALSADVTEHCGYDTMMGIFREAFRLLKPGGTYFIYTPNPLHWIERLKEWGIILKQHPSHTGLRTAPVISDALQKVGFEIVMHPQPPSMIPIFNWFEKLWSLQPVGRNLGIYRVVLLARKPAGS
ncbi:MAG TPA: methyltransferase domain-containing protein [Tepidisphaeraceae bacterium]|nr:methyltransferase domain-containing protein [Tepidisphaeraceae bacterium]